MLNVVKFVSEITPLRPPSLFIDRILEIEPGKRTKALKNITINESYFMGMPEEDMKMPEVKFIELFGQLGNATFLSASEFRGKKFGMMTLIKSFTLHRQAVPGDQIIVEFEFFNNKRTTGKGRGTAKIDGEIVCEAELVYIIDQEAQL
ncbi:MAG: 3-hydroxyacyl-ACP dehydratase FabZ family protein [Tumebacillaceae bacterium]